MRYGPLVSKPWAALKAASEGNYRIAMLVLMLAELVLLVVLVVLEGLELLRR